MSDEQKEKRTDSILWPDIDTLEGARSATMQGVWAAGLVSAVTLAASLYAHFATEFMNMSLGAVVDAVIFAALAFAIWKKSRFAAIAGLVVWWRL